MGTYRKILVAIDGSEPGFDALRVSFKLAEAEKSWIAVLSVIPGYEGDLGASWVDNIKESMRKPCMVALSEAERIAREKGVSIKTICEEGEIFERIVDVADAENCGLIVMGRKGRSALERSLIGSVTARVIGLTQRDVLVVPRGSDMGWGHLLLATDGSKYSKPAVEKAIEVAKSYGSRLGTISVVDVTDEFFARAPQAVEDMVNKAKAVVEEIRKQAAAEGIDAEGLVREGEAYKVIVDMARDLGSGTIIMGSHGRTGLRRLLMGSVTEKVIGHASCPVLVVKA